MFAQDAAWGQPDTHSCSDVDPAPPSLRERRILFVPLLGSRRQQRPSLEPEMKPVTRQPLPRSLPVRGLLWGWPALPLHPQAASPCDGHSSSCGLGSLSLRACTCVGGLMGSAGAHVPMDQALHPGGQLWGRGAWAVGLLGGSAREWEVLARENREGRHSRCHPERHLRGP